MKMNEKLKNLRVNHKMTLKELSTELGFAENTIHNYESNKRQPDIETIKKYATIFKVNVEDIINDGANPIIIYEDWINKEKIDLLLKNESVNITRDDEFALFFEPMGDGCIAWGYVEVSKFDGDVDAEINKLEFKNNDFSHYIERVINRIWDFTYDDETVSAIFVTSTFEQKPLWEKFEIEWLDGDWVEDELEENRLRIFR